MSKSLKRPFLCQVNSNVFPNHSLSCPFRTLRGPTSLFSKHGGHSFFSGSISLYFNILNDSPSWGPYFFSLLYAFHTGSSSRGWWAVILCSFSFSTSVPSTHLLFILNNDKFYYEEIILYCD